MKLSTRSRTGSASAETAADQQLRAFLSQDGAAQNQAAPSGCCVPRTAAGPR